jgi:hypothetical protein
MPHPTSGKPSFLSVSAKILTENKNEACSGPQRLGAGFKGKPEIDILYNII